MPSSSPKFDPVAGLLAMRQPQSAKDPVQDIIHGLLEADVDPKQGKRDSILCNHHLEFQNRECKCAHSHNSVSTQCDIFLADRATSITAIGDQLMAYCTIRILQTSGAIALSVYAC